jgi:hypothetical protein
MFCKSLKKKKKKKKKNIQNDNAIFFDQEALAQLVLLHLLGLQKDPCLFGFTSSKLSNDMTKAGPMTDQRQGNFIIP